MKHTLLTIWLLLLLALSACGPPPGSAPMPSEPDGGEDTAVSDPTPEPSEPSEPEFDTHPATINDFEILILESFPVQVNVNVTGMLNGGCSELGEVRVVQTDSTFSIEIDEVTELNVACTMALVPFAEVVSLPVDGLAAGEYSVMVNGSEPQRFTLDMDNSLSADPAEPVSTGQAYITAVTITTVDETNGRATVQIQGDLSNGCTAIDDIVVTGPEDNTFTAEIITSQPADLMCTEALVPFTQTIVLEDLMALQPGEYRVLVGGVSATFQLGGEDNLGEQSAQPESKYERAPVSRVTLTVDETSRIASIVVRGELPDGCEGVAPDPAGIMLVGENELRLDVVRTKPEGVMCPMVITPYDKLITVDVSTLAPGEYTLTVNGTTAVLTVNK